MGKKKTSHVKSRKTSRQSQASRKSGKEKSTKKITGKQQSKASSKKLSKKASKTARKSSTEKEPVKARKSAAKVGPVKGKKSAAKASKRAVKARKHAVTVSKKVVKGKKSAAKAGKLPAKGKKLSAKALEALRRSEANAKRRALYAEKKAAEAKEEAAKAKKRASKSSKQAVKAEKQTVKAEKKRKTTKTDVSRLLDKVRQLEDEKAALIEAAKAKPKKSKKPKPPPAEARQKKPPKPRPVSRVFVRGLADTRGYSEGKEPEEKRTRVGGKGNKHSFNYTGVFDAVFKAKTRRIPMASDEVPIYRYGITVRVADIQNVSAAIQDMTEFLNASMPGGFSAHIVREDDSSISVSVNLGDYENESNSLSALRQIKKHSNLIASVVDRARSYSEDSDDFEWYPHWDWNAEFDEITVSP